MVLNKALLFPRMNLACEKLRPLSASTLWTLCVLAIVVLVYLPSLFTGFFGDDNWHRLEFSGDAARKLDMDENVIVKGAYDLYAFSGFNRERWMEFRDKGIFPWWSSGDIRINLFRPLSSLILALDYTLWPHSPLLMHVHSLLWFILLTALVSKLFRRIFGNGAIAAVALLVFAADDVNAGVSWISNRHSVIAMVFGVLGLLFFMSAGRKKLFPILSAISLALSLLASEMGVISFVFILLHAFYLDGRPWRERAVSLIPIISIAFAWFFTRTYLGYGTSGSILYIDPFESPVRFLLDVPLRFFPLLLSATGLPVADMLMLLSPAGSVVAAAISFALLSLFFALVRFIFIKNRIAVFFGAATVLSILPLVSGFPRNTILGFPGIGIAGLAAILIRRLVSARKSEFGLARRIGLEALLPWICFCFFVVGPLYIVAMPSTFETASALQARAVDFDAFGDVRDKHVIVVNPPPVSMMEAGLVARLFTEKPFPARIRYLTSGESKIGIERIDANTIRVTPSVPFPFPPGEVRDETTGRISHMHTDIINRWTNSFYYNPDNPLRTGNTIDLAGVRITVTNVTGDGRIAGITFRFDRPLEDPSYMWLRWDAQSRMYATAKMPQTGETIVY